MTAAKIVYSPDVAVRSMAEFEVADFDQKFVYIPVSGVPLSDFSDIGLLRCVEH